MIQYTDIKKTMKEFNGKILIATEGTFQMGENVPNLHYLILAQIRKSEIAQVQMIGRILRKAPGKDRAYVFDIADNLMVTTTKEDGTFVRKNFGKRHLKLRLETYKKYGFKIKEIQKVILS